MRFLPSNSLDPTAEDVLRIRIIPDQAATEYTSCRMTLGKTSQPLGEDFLDMEQKRKEAESPMWVCQDGVGSALIPQGHMLTELLSLQTDSPTSRSFSLLHQAMFRMFPRQSLPARKGGICRDMPINRLTHKKPIHDFHC